MSKLVLKLNGEVIDDIPLQQGDMKIGRKPGCNVVLDNMAVSGEHANVFTVGHDSFMQDLGSTNGTFINSQRITKHHLRSGDIVTIGNHTMVFLAESTGQPAGNDDAKTVMISAPPPAQTKPLRPSLRAVEPVAAPSARNGVLLILDGSNTGKRTPLIHSVTNLGKAGRRAGAIHHSETGYTLVPGEHNEPLKLNGRPVLADGAKLQNGDVIDAVGTRLQFYIK